MKHYTEQERTDIERRRRLCEHRRASNQRLRAIKEGVPSFAATGQERPFLIRFRDADADLITLAIGLPFDSVSVEIQESNRRTIWLGWSGSKCQDACKLILEAVRLSRHALRLGDIVDLKPVPGTFAEVLLATSEIGAE